MTETFLTINVNNVTKKEKDISINVLFTSLNTPNIKQIPVNVCSSLLF